MIELCNVTKLYGTVIGVNDMSLTLESGAHGLLGPNGSGKTTFLNLITGQLHPTLGTVRIFGEDPRNNVSVLRRLGVCPGDEAMYTNVSGLAWVRFLLELHGFPADEAEYRARDALERVGMRESMDRLIGAYSRGMRQRTKMAQAMAHDPDLLVLDEPFNGLDPIGRHELTELLLGWIRGGKSLILASHILYEVDAISHSFMLICGGRLLASGAAEEVGALLTSVPREVRIRCDRPRELAQRLIAAHLAEGVRIEGEGTLVLASPHPEPILRELPECIRQTGIRVDELWSSDDSLQSVFDNLMKMHRGGEA